MHIGFFTDGFTPQLNGVATSLEALRAALEQAGHRVSIFTAKMGNYIDRRPGIYRFPSILAIKDPPLYLATPLSTRVLYEIPRLGLEVVHVHTPFACEALGYQVARRAKLPLVMTYHTLLPAHLHHVKFFGRYTFPAGLAEWFSAWSCNLCDHVIAPSEKIKGLLEQYGVHRPITVMHNGVDLARFQNRPRGYLRGRFGLGADAKIVLAVGRLTADKNFAFLIEVLSRVGARDANIHLVIVGHGPQKAEFQARAQALGVARHLVLTGPLPPSEMPDVFADADVYVTASFSEVHSIAALEALAAGLPLVVVRDQSLSLMVTPGENGFVVEPDADAFAAHILEILAQPARHAQMRAASRARVRDFSVTAQAEKLLNLYAQLIAARQNGTARASAQALPET